MSCGSGKRTTQAPKKEIVLEDNNQIDVTIPQIKQVGKKNKTTKKSNSGLY